LRGRCWQRPNGNARASGRLSASPFPTPCSRQDRNSKDRVPVRSRQQRGRANPVDRKWSCRCRHTWFLGGEERRILRDAQKLAVTKSPALRCEVAAEDHDLSEEWFTHSVNSLMYRWICLCGEQVIMSPLLWNYGANKLPYEITICDPQKSVLSPPYNLKWSRRGRWNLHLTLPNTRASREN
jgi:hypothetical protein